MNSRQLTLCVHRWLQEHNLKASTAKQWKSYAVRGVHKYWWNWFRVEGQWWGFEVYDDGTVERVC